MKAKCDKCGKEFEKEDAKSLAQALRMHQARMHGHMRNSQLEKNYRAARTAPSKAEAVKPDRGDYPDSKSHRNAYKAWYRRMHPGLDAKRKAAKRLANNGAVSTVIHYCPQCGFNMEVLATALAVVERSK